MGSTLLPDLSVYCWFNRKWRDMSRALRQPTTPTSTLTRSGGGREPPRGRQRVENLVSWFSASVLVTVGVIYVLKMQEDLERVPPAPLVPRPSPAQEPLALQKKRAV